MQLVEYGSEYFINPRGDCVMVLLFGARISESTQYNPLLHQLSYRRELIVFGKENSIHGRAAQYGKY